MQLTARELIASLTDQLKKDRQQLKRQPGLALIWVGEDPATAVFIRAKQRLANELECQFFLHHFPTASGQQLEAVIDGLNGRKDIDGIVLQLPLPKSINTESLIKKVSPTKDIDNISDDSPYMSPTPSGIIALLRHHNIVTKDLRTIILGAGKLVGTPLAKMFVKNNWPVTVIANRAEKQIANIRRHDLLIAATGVRGLVTPAMVHKNMIVVDGSGFDADVEEIEPLVKAITPTKGAIGPLTVSYLFANLFLAANQKSKITG